MLTGTHIGLRARHEDDTPVLRAGLHNDVVNAARASSSPWVPLGPDSKDSRAEVDPDRDDRVPFSVVELEGGKLIGAASVWDIDAHNRNAHLGLELLPSARGKGYGTDVVATLCHYAFVVRSLHRLQVETLADNPAMLAAAERNGFVREGVLKSAAWVMGEFVDEVILGLLVEDWKQR